jgi:hypothetical protein
MVKTGQRKAVHLIVARKQRDTERKRLGTRYTLQRHTSSNPLPPIRSHLSVSTTSQLSNYGSTNDNSIDEVTALMIQSLANIPTSEHCSGNQTFNAQAFQTHSITKTTVEIASSKSRRRKDSGPSTGRPEALVLFILSHSITAGRNL